MGANFFRPGNSIAGNFELDGFECVSFGVPSLFGFFSFFAEPPGDTVAGVCFSTFTVLCFFAGGGVTGADAAASGFSGEAAGVFLFLSLSGCINVRPIFAASSSSKLSPSVNEEVWLSSTPGEGPAVVDDADVDGCGEGGAASGGGGGRGSGAGGGTNCGRASGAGAPPCGTMA